MKILHVHIEDEKTLVFQLEPETQAEEALLFEIAVRMPKSITAYGKIDKDRTWAWFDIPILQAKMGDAYFGNANKPK